MDEKLPDIVLDGTTPALFLTGFAGLLLALLGALGIAAWLARRARMAGIHAKYGGAARRRTVDSGAAARNKARI